MFAALRKRVGGSIDQFGGERPNEIKFLEVHTAISIYVRGVTNGLLKVQLQIVCDEIIA